MSALPLVTAFGWVPDFARGKVRDLRVRWALEELDRPYRTELLDATHPRDDAYRSRQPFGQVPAFDDGDVSLFESGAILLYLAEHEERLLPREARARWEAVSWLIAALNSVEPMLMQIVNIDIFNAGQDWTKAARPGAVELAVQRLQDVSDALGDKQWLEGRFSVADIMMVTVLRNIDHTDIVPGFPNLAAYKARGEARPAFVRALGAQCAEFSLTPPQGAMQ